MPQSGGNYITFIVTLLVSICFLDLAWTASYQLQSYDLDMDNGGVSNSSEAEYNGGITSLERPLSWLRNANSMFGGPAGHVVIQVAKELLHRSAGNSQVLSLNLTNLLIIILLKILIFSAGMLGAGHWSGYGYGHGRSASDNNFGLGLTSGDDYLITGFLAAQGAGRDECLYAASCACPTSAYEYAKAGRALMGAIEVFQGVPLEKPRYVDLIVLMERAAYDGFRGVACNTTQTCDGLL
ncbi:LOW QUALITY PROTEIN: uncharacterized protein LOC108117494 [Drosophila eugracilis]|uniref:LOW QUALITY PROTEIN: uncharacterized protein LOC108117494 n=1 Tax=Drosophila eugracilis TaxID=29029 RepID=UPI001BD9BDCF|nr:LOW QUALITY PROTEIN: uncharacterized protein LOC108117494 [Drosophila eugracilis]